MSVDQERTIEITVNVHCPKTINISVPPHFSLDQVREAIRSAISQREQGAYTLDPDLSSIRFASSSKGFKAYEGDAANAPIGQIVSDDKVFLAMVPVTRTNVAGELNEALQ